MDLLLLKLQGVELENRTESRLSIANWHCKLSKIRFWTATSGKWQVVRWHHSDVFNVIFEIRRHVFLVFLLLTLSIVFFYLSTLWEQLHNCNLLSYRNEAPPESSLRLFRQSQLERVWITFKLSKNKLHHWHLPSVFIKFWVMVVLKF